MLNKTAAGEVEKREGAYVTLLYGEDFLLGVRVLGQSIRETKTTYDLVVIVTGALSKQSQKTLRRDGWIVRNVDTIANPGKGPQSGKGYPARFSAVYTKLTIFNLTQYKKVVYLDADTIMLRNSDELFECPGFCAALRHSERLNSGVMTVTPSEDMYNDMISKIATYPSYTGGDQGFLNAYFEDFINAPLFDSEEIPTDANMMRLPTGYNADIGLYLLNSNRWMISQDDIKIVHYTLGPFKPWNWWTSWVITDLDAWQKFRYDLPEDSFGNRHGVTGPQRFWIRVLSWLPFGLTAGLYYKYFHGARTASANNEKAEAIPSTSSAPLTHSLMSKVGLPKRFVGNSICIGYATLLLPLWLVLAMIPHKIFPFWGWLLSYEWIVFLHGSLFSLYLKYCYDTGRKAGASNLPTFKFASWSNPWRVTLKSFGISVLIMILTPWVSSLLQISSLIPRLVVTVASALVLCIMLTHVYSTLPVRWFSHGRHEGTGKIGS